jgi:cytidylate kinase
MNKLILFTGLSGAGKSSLAQRISHRFSFHLIGEREVLHKLAEEAGFKRSRLWVANDDFEKILQAARLETSKQIQECGSNQVVLDGVYDKSMIPFLNKLLPDFIQLSFFIDAKYSTRLLRIAARMHVDEREATIEQEFIDGYKERAGINEVINQADIVIDNNNNLEQAEIAMIEGLRDRRFLESEI